MKKTPKLLTNKQKLFIKHLVDNPKSTATDAYKEAYDTQNMKPATINREAHATTRLPQVITELSKYNGLIEDTLINTVNDYKNSDRVNERALAVDISKYVHDKIHGKATQRTEVISTGITLTIDLTSSLVDGQPTEADQSQIKE